MSDKPDLMNIIEAAMNTCHAEGDYDPENDYIKDPLCRRVYHALGQSAAEITRLRDAVRVLGAEYQKIREHAWHGDFSNGVVSDSGVDEGDVRHVDYMDRSAKIVESNPIAAAAVKGTQ